MISPLEVMELSFRSWMFNGEALKQVVVGVVSHADMYTPVPDIH